MAKNRNHTDKHTLTTRHLAALLAASPEGFFPQTKLSDPKLGAGSRAEIVAEAVAEGEIGREGEFLFDLARLSAEQVRERSTRYRGSMPALKLDGRPAVRAIVERMKIREQRLVEMDDPVFTRIVSKFQHTEGFLPYETLCTEPGDEGALILLGQLNILKQFNALVFDPLRISRESLEAMHERQTVIPARDEMLAALQARPGQTMPRAALVEKYGSKLLERAMAMGGMETFSVQSPKGESVWVRAEGLDPEAALQAALEAVQPKDSDWVPFLDLCDLPITPEPPPGETFKGQVIAASMPVNLAARKLGVKEATLQSAVLEKQVTAFVDPEGKTRLPLREVEAIQASPNWVQALEDMEVIHLREIKLAFGESRSRNLISRARRRSSSRIRWGNLRDALVGSPDAALSLKGFYQLVNEGKVAWKASVLERREEERRLREEERRQRDEQRRERDALRARLLASFPNWAHPGRADQRVTLHVGPTNSGKTHQALEALRSAGQGWYLAPLRLLAYEIFDRLNRNGVFCNLLTGEEYIPVPGAHITAATIEMFNPTNSGDLVVIDEAHMLADPDRGWAWTRALMEAQAPEIRVITPPFARTLVERLVTNAAMPLEVVEHHRLAPLEIAPRAWTLEDMPEKTILVAFSRRMVLKLKTELEKYQRRVSVIYGNLPPEVRRRQADRFALGETEICVATDAVGMGLNLPADNVCFYELEKFDGKEVRLLTSAEVHQIGGRAGRYGYSTSGLVGATSRAGLRLLRQLYENLPDELRRARVAPEVEDLEMIPGSLAHRFAQWRELESIPESLRDVIEPADIDERIALAQMLSDEDVESLGLAAAVQLVNAPTRENSRPYWIRCAHAIIAGEPMPFPQEAPVQIESDFDLEATESAISCADIYLWLASRREFTAYGEDEAWVRSLRAEWSLEVDAALLRRLDTASRCINCRTKLPVNHRYALCDSCYYASRVGWHRGNR
ncbi:MAG: hypothetical protein IAE83_20505 [Anaerolinea sp.]|nr:hypothetical protein [Anaerolinea sp.]MCC6974644.1 hypothetical protein [Anaerolineae bacterium]